MKVFKNGITYLPDGTLMRKDLSVDNGRICTVGEAGTLEGEEMIDADNHIIAPGFFDIHIHGARGSDFSDGTAEDIDNIAGYLLTQGVTGFLGTTMSLGENELSGIMSVAAPLVGKTREKKAVLWGINMEGPFLAMSKKGGQNGNYIIEPDIGMFDRLYERSAGNIRLIDIAPELNGALDFINKARSHCRISLAHTEADYASAKRAFEAGAGHVTHLFNAMTPINHRYPGMITAAVENAGFVEVICDGIHIHPAIIRMIYKLFEKDRVCIISDSMRACGMEDGEYNLGGQMVYVTEGRAVLKDGTLAGSTTTSTQGMRNAVSFGIPLEEALQAVTLNPARAVGLDHLLGSLKPGNRADLVLLNQKLEVKSVFLEGNKQL